MVPLKSETTAFELFHTENEGSLVSRGRVGERLRRSLGILGKIFLREKSGRASLVYDRWNHRDGTELNNGIAVLLEFNLKAAKPHCACVHADVHIRTYI